MTRVIFETGYDAVSKGLRVFIGAFVLSLAVSCGGGGGGGVGAAPTTETPTAGTPAPTPAPPNEVSEIPPSKEDIMFGFLDAQISASSIPPGTLINKLFSDNVFNENDITDAVTITVGEAAVQVDLITVDANGKREYESRLVGQNNTLHLFGFDAFELLDEVVRNEIFSGAPQLNTESGLTTYLIKSSIPVIISSVTNEIISVSLEVRENTTSIGNKEVLQRGYRIDISSISSTLPGYLTTDRTVFVREIPPEGEPESVYEIVIFGENGEVDRVRTFGTDGTTTRISITTTATDSQDARSNGLGLYDNLILQFLSSVSNSGSSVVTDKLSSANIKLPSHFSDGVRQQLADIGMQVERETEIADSLDMSEPPVSETVAGNFFVGTGDEFRYVGMQSSLPSHFGVQDTGFRFQHNFCKQCKSNIWKDWQEQEWNNDGAPASPFFARAGNDSFLFQTTGDGINSFINIGRELHTSGDAPYQQLGFRYQVSSDKDDEKDTDGWSSVMELSHIREDKTFLGADFGALGDTSAQTTQGRVVLRGGLGDWRVFGEYEQAYSDVEVNGKYLESIDGVKASGWKAGVEMSHIWRGVDKLRFLVKQDTLLTGGKAVIGREEVRLDAPTKPSFSAGYITQMDKASISFAIDHDTQDNETGILAQYDLEL